jgi:hypothetical protein
MLPEAFSGFLLYFQANNRLHWSSGVGQLIPILLPFNSVIKILTTHVTLRSLSHDTASTTSLRTKSSETAQSLQWLDYGARSTTRNTEEQQQATSRPGPEGSGDTELDVHWGGCTWTGRLSCQGWQPVQSGTQALCDRFDSWYLFNLRIREISNLFALDRHVRALNLFKNFRH